MKKEGQVTIFIILGIVIVIIIVFLLYLSYSTKNIKLNVLTDYSLSSQINSVKNYVKNCLTQTLRDGLVTLGLDENLLIEYINSHLDECINNFAVFQKKDLVISHGTLGSDVYINNQSIIAEIHCPIEIKKKDSTHQLSEFSVSLPRESIGTIKMKNEITTSKTNIMSTDDRATITIPAKTKLISHYPINNISIILKNNEYDKDRFGLVWPLIYEIKPDISFNPPLTLTISYGNLPSKINEADLEVVYYNESVDEFMPYPTTIDTTKNIATAEITHFSDVTLGRKRCRTTTHKVDLIDKEKLVKYDFPQNVNISYGLTTNKGIFYEARLCNNKGIEQKFNGLPLFVSSPHGSCAKFKGENVPDKFGNNLPLFVNNGESIKIRLIGESKFHDPDINLSVTRKENAILCPAPFPRQNFLELPKKQIPVSSFSIEKPDFKLDMGKVSDIAIADLDRDCYEDLIVVTSYGTFNEALIYFGKGSFDNTPDIILNMHSATSAEATDLNNDGNLDLVFSGKGDNEMITYSDAYVSYGDGTRYGFDKLNRLPVSSASDVSAGDINKDGWQDLIFNTDNKIGDIYLYFGSSEGFSPKNLNRLFSSGKSSDIEVIDLDDDGNLDIIYTITDDVQDGVKILWGKDGGFDGESTFITASGAYEIEIADLNLDKNLDIILASNLKYLTQEETSSFVSPKSLIYYGDGTKYGFDNRKPIELLTDFATNVKSIDLNNDGLLDLVFARGKPSYYRSDEVENLYIDDSHVYYGRSSGFTDRSDIYLRIVNAGTVESADIDNDGFKDLIVCGDLGCYGYYSL